MPGDIPAAYTSFREMKKTVAEGVVHEVPEALREVLLAHPEVLDKWNALAPLGFVG